MFPEHLKYEQTQKAPYAALLDRLRAFLATPDTLLISVGFSFADAISVDLGLGEGRATVYTCDLTHGYITINGDYRS